MNNLKSNFLLFLFLLIIIPGLFLKVPSVYADNLVATIGGKVVGANGAGVNGVKVWISDESSSVSYSGGKYKSVTTGSDGKFSSQITIGTRGFWVRIPDQASLGADGVSNMAIFTAKEATTAPFGRGGAYEAQQYDNISHGCWDNCNFTVQLISPTVARTCPVVPANLKVNNGQGVSCNSSTIALSWDQISSAQSYHVRVNDPGTTLPAFSASGPQVSAPSYLCPPNADGSPLPDVCINEWVANNMTVNVTPGKTYSWWVHSFSSVAPSCLLSNLTLGEQFTVPVCSTSSPTPPVAAYTTEYRCSDIRFEKNDVPGGNIPAWKPYQNTDFSGEPIKFKYTFSDNVAIGKDLTLFCQFKADTGTTSQVYPKNIKYIGDSPKITSTSCSYDPTGVGTQVTVKGENFGQHSDQLNGNVKIAGKDTTVSYWAKDNTGTGSAQIQDKVISRLRDKLDDGKYPIVLTTDEGRSANGYCFIGLTTVDFVTKTQCGTVSSMPDVTLEVKEKVDNAKVLDKKKTKLSADGRAVDYAPKLEIGKEYVLRVSSANTLSRRVEFTAEEGTTSLENITLLNGDIGGPGGQADNVINAFDKSKLSQEWNIVSDVSRSGDFNGDNRVNSVDYACLRQNFNKVGE